MEWYKPSDRMPMPSDERIVALYNDGCTVMHLTHLDGVGWVHAEDGEAWVSYLDDITQWCHAPADYEPHFMTLTGD